MESEERGRCQNFTGKEHDCLYVFSLKGWKPGKCQGIGRIRGVVKEKTQCIVCIKKNRILPFFIIIVVLLEVSTQRIKQFSKHQEAKFSLLKSLSLPTLQTTQQKRPWLKMLCRHTLHPPVTLPMLLVGTRHTTGSDFIQLHAERETLRKVEHQFTAITGWAWVTATESSAGHSWVSQEQLMGETSHRHVGIYTRSDLQNIATECTLREEADSWQRQAV